MLYAHPAAAGSVTLVGVADPHLGTVEMALHPGSVNPVPVTARAAPAPLTLHDHIRLPVTVAAAPPIATEPKEFPITLTVEAAAVSVRETAPEPTLFPHISK